MAESLSSHPFPSPNRTPLNGALSWCWRHPTAVLVGIAALGILLAVAVLRQTRPAYLDLTVTPPEAEVTLDGRPLTMTGGSSLMEASPGRHQLSIRAAGYEPQERAIDLVRGRDNAVRANIRLQSRFGRLHAVSTPGGAAVEVLDAKGRVVARGTTPFYSPRLPHREYTLRFTKDLRAAHQVRATVPTGERTEEVPAFVLSLANGAEDSFRALACLRAAQAPWKGRRHLDDPALTLGQFLDEITRLYGVPITVNASAFVAEGSDADRIRSTPIGDRGLDLGPKAHELSVGAVLQRVLDLAAQVSSGATFVPRKLSEHSYGWEVTTRDFMLREGVTVLHPVSDLVTDAGGMDGARLAEAVKEQLPSWVTGEFLFQEGTGPDRQPLLPEGVIHFLPQSKAILVTHNWRLQEAVHGFLNQLRQSRCTRGAVPALLQPKGDMTEGERLLVCLRAGRTPWKGPARYDDPSFTLGQLLNEITRLHDIIITLNTRAFIAEGTDTDKALASPICERPLDLGSKARELSVRTVLERVLDRLVFTVPSGMTIVPKKLASGRYGWEVTTGSFMRRNPVVVLHAVKDLVTGPGALSGQQLEAAVQRQMPFWTVPLMPLWVANDVELLASLPPTPIHFLPSSSTLQVTHNWRIQEAVLDFLNQLRVARRNHGILPSALQPVGDVTDSNRLLVCLRDASTPWKGAGGYGDLDMTFQEFLQEVANLHGVPVSINALTFRAEEVGEDDLRWWRPFLREALDLGPHAKQLSLREVLRRVFDRVPTKSVALLVPKKLAGNRYGLEITTAQFMLGERFTILHPVGDLVAKGWSEDQLMRAVKGQLPFWEGWNPLTGTGLDPEKQPPRRGVPIEFFPHGKVLLVTHNWRVQETVHSFLNQLRQATRTGGLPSYLQPPADEPPESSRLLACARASWVPWKGPHELDGSLSLRRFLQLASRHHGVEVTLNERAFEAEKPALLDQPIGKGTVPGNPKWSVRTVLLNVVKGLRGRGGVALVPRKLSERTFGWEVTTAEAAEAEQYTVLHPAGDLLTGAGALTKEQLMATVRGQLPLRERAVASVEFSPLGRAVVVSYNWRVQEQIDGYLNQLRQVRRREKGAP